MSENDSESTNIISLEDHARRVKEGEIFRETLRSGDCVEFRVRPPKQGIAYHIQSVMQEVISKNPELMEAQATGGRVQLTDAGAVLRLQELDGRALMACVDGVNEDNVMYYVEELTPECRLLQRVKQLCGVGNIELEEDSEGN